MSIKQVILILILSVLVVCSDLLSQNIEPQVDEYINAQIKLDRFSGVVFAAKDGNILFNKGYGMANHELDVPNTPETKFRIGSVTKQFTAMLIMKLEEKGKLKVTDHVSTFIADYPRGGEITIHQLLTHTSGVPDLLEIDGFEEIKRNPLKTKEVVEFFKNVQLDFEPGTKYKYSNSGYVLLSYIIELVTGKSYEEFINENIFAPLEMNNTAMDNSSRVIKNRADGYFPASKELVNAPFVSMTIPAGGGGMISTAEDLYKWDRSFYAGKLLSESSYDKMLTPYADESYCYGWRKVEEFGKTCYRHGGGIEGFKAELRRYPDDNAFVMILSNVINSPVKNIAKDVSAILFGEEYEVPVEKTYLKVAPEILNSYAGQYELAPENFMGVFYDDGKLFIAPPGQPKLEIFPETETDFVIKAFPGKLSFSTNDAGDVTGLTFFVGGREMKAKKIN